MDAKTIILGVSAFVAVIALFLNNKANKRKSTIDLVLNQRSDEKLIESRRTVLELNKTGKITQYSAISYAGSPERDAILDVLNNYEFIATGMRERAFDVSLFRRMRYTTITKDWDALKPFVYELRRQQDTNTVFQEFEWLAKRFKRKGLKQDEK